MENIGSLLSRHATVLANDFVLLTIAGFIRFISQETNTLVIELDSPLELEGRRYSWVVASPRLERDSLDTLLSLKSLSCGVTWVPDERFNRDVPFDVSWWRGGAAAITDIVID